MTACQTLNIFYLRLFLVGECFYTQDLVSISTNDPACGGNKLEVENSFFFFLMNERTKNLRRKFLQCHSAGENGAAQIIFIR